MIITDDLGGISENLGEARRWEGVCK